MVHLQEVTTTGMSTPSPVNHPTPNYYLLSSSINGAVLEAEFMRTFEVRSREQMGLRNQFRKKVTSSPSGGYRLNPQPDPPPPYWTNSTPPPPGPLAPYIRH